MARPIAPLGSPTMHPIKGDTTRPTLLARAGDWTDHAAWRELVACYDRPLRLWCRQFGLDAETADEVVQRVWVDLARRLSTFRYDPGKTFRGWLRIVCHRRAQDVLASRRRTDPLPGEVSDRLTAAWPGPEDDTGQDDHDASARRPWLLQVALQAQASVASKVDPDSWRAFWLIAVEDRPVRETSEALGKSYAATYMAYNRVRQRLRREGERLLAESAGGGASRRPEGSS
ncbi:MAG: sigma-70 family RNA polymerase sigma factor [Isosphaeraceae bacterium]